MHKNLHGARNGSSVFSTQSANTHIEGMTIQNASNGFPSPTVGIGDRGDALGMHRIADVEEVGNQLKHALPGARVRSVAEALSLGLPARCCIDSCASVRYFTDELLQTKVW
jgi:hypothetical protein